MPDDGHAIKLARAVGVCEELTKKYQDRDWVLIKGDDVWAKIHHLVLDSLQSPGEYWVRSAGLDEAWTVSIMKLFSTHHLSLGGTIADALQPGSTQAVTLWAGSARWPYP